MMTVSELQRKIRFKKICICVCVCVCTDLTATMFVSLYINIFVLTG